MKEKKKLYIVVPLMALSPLLFEKGAPRFYFPLGPVNFVRTLISNMSYKYTVGV